MADFGQKRIGIYPAGPVFWDVPGVSGSYRAVYGLTPQPNWNAEDMAYLTYGTPPMQHGGPGSLAGPPPAPFAPAMQSLNAPKVQGGAESAGTFYSMPLTNEVS